MMLIQSGTSKNHDNIDVFLTNFKSNATADIVRTTLDNHTIATNIELSAVV